MTFVQVKHLLEEMRFSFTNYKIKICYLRTAEHIFKFFKLGASRDIGFGNKFQKFRMAEARIIGGGEL